ncbi:hypothetical protein EHQ23_16950 [Leptospira bourretii]|uniref:Uncharacterized protein n=2 Tax=Leptospira bourretii TaxID=2484962 RepID=A0A4R9ILC4_9LEPT|nr:hypothetical protein [Leptospira bourretii]TGK79298.1 hypothetical protein EHQ23_16950 [Leptospira bourretii]TGK89504.1 hypothetical protein EHQ26_13800 [Leptospira bourretii]
MKQIKILILLLCVYSLNAKDSNSSDNRSNQMNPNNDAYWQSRGYDERPSDWDASSNDDADNHSNQMNPNNDAYWQSRGYDERPNDWNTSSDKYDDYNNYENPLNLIDLFENNKLYNDIKEIFYPETHYKNCRTPKEIIDDFMKFKTDKKYYSENQKIENIEICFSDNQSSQKQNTIFSKLKRKIKKHKDFLIGFLSLLFAYYIFKKIKL